MLLERAYNFPNYIPESIFRSSGICGIPLDSLSIDIMYVLGQAIGTEAKKRGQDVVVVSRDCRPYSTTLISALTDGLMASGRHVVDIGVMPTPLLYFATSWLETRSGVMVTGSHYPINHNGLKIVLGGTLLTGDNIQQLYRRIISHDLTSSLGSLEVRDVHYDYVERTLRNIKLNRPLRIVIDAGNSITANIAPKLYHDLGCEVIEIFCKVESHFPHHFPDPTVKENLRDLQEYVVFYHADLGIAFDEDGGRLGVVTDKGEIVQSDHLFMLFAQDLLARCPDSNVIFDVGCTNILRNVIKEAGGIPMVGKTDPALIRAKMKRSRALLGGNRYGNFLFKERWYGFDDALYAASKLLEILARRKLSAHEVFAELPPCGVLIEFEISLSEYRKPILVQKLAEIALLDEKSRITTLDGVRIDFEDGWGLVQPIEDKPCILLRFEARDEISLKRIQALFRVYLLRADATLAIPY